MRNRTALTAAAVIAAAGISLAATGHVSACHPGNWPDWCGPEPTTTTTTTEPTWPTTTTPETTAPTTTSAPETSTAAPTTTSTAAPTTTAPATNPPSTTSTPPEPTTTTTVVAIAPPPTVAPSPRQTATVYAHVDCDEIVLTFENSQGLGGATFTYSVDGGELVTVALRKGQSEAVFFGPDVTVTVWAEGEVVAVVEPAGCSAPASPSPAPATPIVLPETK